MNQKQWQVNYEKIKDGLINPDGMLLTDLLKVKEISRINMLQAVEERNGETFAIQVLTDAPALKYQTNFWNFWNVVKELREKFDVPHKTTGAVYE